MHEAYLCNSLTKLTYQIESITAYDDVLLVGTRQGHLFMYNLIRDNDKYELELTRYNKSFSKKAIQQIAVIPEYNFLLSLTDNLVQVHDINSINFNIVHQIHKSKGATLFALNIQKKTTLSGETTTLVSLAVAVKRKLQLYYLKRTEFLPLMEDIALADVPRSMEWCEDAICVGFRGEYVLVGTDRSQLELFPTSGGRAADPCIVKASPTAFALCREAQTVLVNVRGQTEQTKTLKWSDQPLTIAWDEPYAFGVFAEAIEVQTLEPSGVVQTLHELSRVRFIVRARQGLVYAASIGQIWCISAVDVAIQRKVLLDSQQFQLALKLTIISNEDEEDKKQKIHQIQTLLAYDLFKHKKFHESMEEFLKLQTDPYDVIRLFPDLLPQNVSAESTEPNKDLTEKELETGLLALIDYLTEMRNRLQLSNKKGGPNSKGNLNETPELTKSTQQLFQIIDTTLLKCYLQTNDALVAPLLRLNHCHLGETEKILKKLGKHNDLIILYQTKGQHRRALELLRDAQALDRTVLYLQHLGGEHLGLILEFADWVMRRAPDEGWRIFADDLPEIEQLPRPRVLDYLLRSYSSVVIRYLEHVVAVWRDANPLFHNALIHQYRERAGDEAATLAERQAVRRKLADFLRRSTSYTAETILGHFEGADALEERAIVLGRLGRHEEVLAVYVRALADVPKAVAYCRGMADARAAFAFLIRLVLEPDAARLGLKGVALSPKTAQADLELALELLEQNAEFVSPLAVLEVLPDSLPVARVHRFLLVALQRAVNDRRRVQLLKGLLYAEHLQCQEMRLNLQKEKILVSELNVCPVCKKRFGNQSALVRYPNGDVVHYSCQEKKN